MDENINSDNNNHKSALSRNIGSGLTRSKLNSGVWGPSRRLSAGASLTPPSRIIISGSSLTPRRTPSDRYQSAYSSRLGGGVTNISTPNLSNVASLKPTSFDRTDRSQVQSDLDINVNQLPRRTNLSSGLTTRLGREEINTVHRRLDGESSVNTDRYNRYDRIAAAGDREKKTEESSVNIERATVRKGNVGDYSGSNLQSTLELLTSTPTSNTEHKSHTYMEGASSGISRLTGSYNLKDNKQEVTAESNGNYGIKSSVISSYSPRSDSGYNSPRVETNIDSFSTSLTRSDRGFDAGSIVLEAKECYGLPVDSSREVTLKVDDSNRSERSDFNQSKTDFQYSDYNRPPRKQRSNSYISRQTELETTPEVTTTKERVSSTTETFASSSNPILEVGQTAKMSATSKSEGQSESSRSTESKDETTPVAKPRTKRRLTKRSISFKRVEEDEFIGFASLPEQVHRKAVRRGFEFTLMVVGETGLGKSTLINSLFLTDLYKDRQVGNIEERLQKTVDLEKKELEIEERGVKLKLTIVDTPGFNDAINAEESWKPIVHYIDKQFEGYFKAESGLNRKNIQDTRVHCCLYFISPYGHGLRPVDISVMKKLHHKVNIVPLIAKADMLTKQEVQRLKQKVLKEIEQHRIQIYQFPECDSDEDEEFKKQDQQLKNSIPFAVVGSNTVVEAGGKKIRGRMYPWGIVEVENPLHCDFTKLRQMLISTHMQDLKDVTCDVHYENYRAEHITEQMSGGQRERNKLKRDSVVNLEAVADTDKLLQEKEAEIKKMQEMLVKMQAQLQKSSPQINGRVGHV